VWGQNFDILGPGAHFENLSPVVYETVVRNLIHIKELFETATELTEKYGLRRETNAPMHELARRTATAEVQRHQAMIDRVKQSCTLFQQFRWVIYDRSSFLGFVQSLSKQIDALYEICPVDRQRELTLAIQCEAVVMTLIDQGQSGIRALQDAVRQGLVPSTLGVGDMVSLANAHGRATTVRLVEQGHYVQPSANLLFSHRDISIHQSDRDASWTTGSLRTAISPPVIIEWRTYNSMTLVDMKKEDLENRIIALIDMLSSRNRPHSFRLLDCVGYFEDQTAYRFGLVFRYPSSPEGVVEDIKPVTLYQILSSRKVPYLGERFALASFLAESIYRFLSAGWLHRNLTSHSLLFFRPSDPWAEEAAFTSLSDPYFSGFALARPDGSHIQDSRRAPSNANFMYYRHPDVMGLQNTPVLRHHPLYDIYSLGTILLEIGTWVRLKRRFVEGSTGLQFRQTLLRDAVPQLGPAMGEKYMTVVQKCMTGRFERVSSFTGHESDYHVCLTRAFYWEVVNVLKTCQV
jgi:hypothetical protein